MAFMRQFFNFIDGVRMRGSDSESDSELNSDQDSSDWSPYAPPRSTHSDENEESIDKPYYQSIITTLKSVERPGYYCAGGMISMPLPSLFVVGLPDLFLGLPLCKAQASDLIELASRAPFGRGEETIVDTSVRCTWQLSPSQFTIGNPDWEESIQTLLARVKADLGCTASLTVTCELYKLLLYEPGGFFKRHRDTEKAANMFGTLVIQLPSNYEGGELLVFHQEKETNFNFSEPAATRSFYFAAFYADCEHEVRPVTKGYRLCLVYNLIYTGVDKCPVPANNKEKVSAIVSAVKAWNEDVESGDCPNMMTYMLEHQYCKAGLSFQLLKNVDRAMGDVLVQAKNEIDFDLYVANVHRSEFFSASVRGYDDYKIDNLSDTCVDAEDPRAYDGTTLASITYFNKQFLVPRRFFHERDPDEENFQEATGNEGATVDKHYHWAGLLMWPVKKRTAVKDGHLLIDNFEKEVKNKKDNTDLVVHAEDVLRELRGRWSCESDRVLKLLLQMDNKELVVRCLDIIGGASRTYMGESFYNVVSAVGLKYGWEILKSPLESVFIKCTSDRVEAYCYFLIKMTTDQMSQEQKELSRCLGRIFIGYLADEQDATPASGAFSHPWRLNGHGGLRTAWDVCRSKEFVCGLVKLLKTLECDDLLVVAVDALCSKPAYYPILETVGPAVVEIGKSVTIEREGPLNTLLFHCVSTLEDSVRSVLALPSHARTVNFSCRCKDCLALKRFMQHPAQQRCRFTIEKHRRKHLQLQLNCTKHDARHEIDYSSKPYALVVSKTQESHNRKVEKRRREQSLLTALQPLLNRKRRSQPPPKKKRKGNE